MKTFSIRVTGFKPYPVVREYVERASSWGTAISRAVKKYLKETKGQGSKRMKSLSVSAGVGLGIKN